MTYNVLVATTINGLSEELEKEMRLRLEEACFESIPTLEGAWEIAVDAPDETEAKNVAIDKFVNVCRTYPFELRMLVQAGTGQIVRRKKTFET